MKKLSYTGDTIVEVLIAVAVVGSVLGGAFAASNRSQRSTQQAQEHTTALKIAESQVELLKVSSDQTSSAIYTTPHLFCIDSSNGSVVQDVITSGVNPVNIGTLLTTYATNSPGDNSLNYGSCRITNGVDYHIAIDRALVPPTADQFTFTVHIRW